MSKKVISVLLTGTSFPRNEVDWRGQFIADMVNALSYRKSISLKTWLPSGKLPSNVYNAALPKETMFMEKLIEDGGIAHILRTKKFSGSYLALKLLKHLRSVYQRELQVDVMHINWLQNAIPMWGNHIPAVITVLGTDFKLLDLPGMVPLIRSVLKQRKSIIAPNAHWMKRPLERYFGGVSRILPIPFGVEQKWFDVSRQISGQKINQWLTVSRLTENKIGQLFKWGQGIFDEKNKLYLFGPNQENLIVPEWIEYQGATYPEELKVKWFPSASGLITLSRHDEGRPQVIIEAMAAGIPVIASDLAAHRDVVKHRKTGWIVSSIEDLKQAIDYLSIPENNNRMGAEAKKFIKEHIGTWEDCACRYEKAYMELAGKPL